MAMEKDPEYKAPHENSIDCFVTLGWEEAQIYEHMNKFSGINTFFFHYYMGLGYYSKKKYDTSIKWFKKALQLGHEKEHHKVYNSIGISYDDLKKTD